jgi:hypothetical protein
MLGTGLGIARFRHAFMPVEITCHYKKKVGKPVQVTKYLLGDFLIFCQGNTTTLDASGCCSGQVQFCRGA